MKKTAKREETKPQAPSVAEVPPAPRIRTIAGVNVAFEIEKAEGQPPVCRCFVVGRRDQYFGRGRTWASAIGSLVINNAENFQ